ncbi:hypothetical protein [Jeotgalibaca sp. A127]|uniref:hypothetical protein n=1 Tax=Jeotgalibaca sp. A127 TaxID=3457324 RepID=UPI003FD2F127
MKLEWNRTAFSILFIMVAMVLGGLVYGTVYLIDPVKERTAITANLVEEQKTLLESYPPDETFLEEIETEYEATQAFLPEGEKVNKDVVDLEKAAAQNSVTINSFSRSLEPQAIEGMDEAYRESVYQVTMTSDTPDNMVALLETLSGMERVWNIQTFSFEKNSEGRYTGSFNVIFYSHGKTE